MKKYLYIIILIILFSVPAILPLFRSGFPVTDDGEWMIIRFSAFHQALRDGQLPVRFLGRLNYGFGYPVANFLYPGFMYLTEPIHLMGFGVVDSIKILIGLSMISSAVFTFLWLSKYFSTNLAFIGSLIYLYAPYHLYDLYKRGSVGELLGLTIVPFIFWQIDRKSFFWQVIGFALLILAHNTLAVMFMPVIIIYFIIKRMQGDFIFLIQKLLIFLLFSFAFSAFFWIPALLELSYTKFSRIQ